MIIETKKNMLVIDGGRGVAIAIGGRETLSVRKTNTVCAEYKGGKGGSLSRRRKGGDLWKTREENC